MGELEILVRCGMNKGKQAWVGHSLAGSCNTSNVLLLQIREYEQVIIEDRIEKEKTREEERTG